VDCPLPEGRGYRNGRTGEAGGQAGISLKGEVSDHKGNFDEKEFAEIEKYFQSWPQQFLELERAMDSAKKAGVPVEDMIAAGVWILTPEGWEREAANAERAQQEQKRAQKAAEAKKIEKQHEHVQAEEKAPQTHLETQKTGIQHEHVQREPEEPKPEAAPPISRVMQEWRQAQPPASFVLSNLTDDELLGPGPMKKTEMPPPSEPRRGEEQTAVAETQAREAAANYSSVLAELAEIANPRKMWKDSVREAWQKPYLEKIAADNEHPKTVEMCLGLARYDASSEGQAALKSMKSRLLENTRDVFSNGLEQLKWVQATLDVIRLTPPEERLQAMAAAIIEIARESRERTFGMSR
jgi:hypothetical protein